jgi:hypothetical protein
VLAWIAPSFETKKGVTICAASREERKGSVIGRLCP